VTHAAYALSPEQFLRSVAASRDSLRRPPMKLLDLLDAVRALTDDAPYAVIGGAAQMLWARKTHTDDIDLAVAAMDLDRAHARVREGQAGQRWRLPTPPDVDPERDEVFEVAHLLCEGCVVDLIRFDDPELTSEIITTATNVAELRGIPFVRPELLLVTHLLLPATRAAIAALELVLARQEAGGFDLAPVERWAARLGKSERLERTLRLAREMRLE
jgi:hypothetical protein